MFTGQVASTHLFLGAPGKLRVSVSSPRHRRSWVITEKSLFEHRQQSENISKWRLNFQNLNVRHLQSYHFVAVKKNLFLLFLEDKQIWTVNCCGQLAFRCQLFICPKHCLFVYIVSLKKKNIYIHHFHWNTGPQFDPHSPSSDTSKDQVFLSSPVCNLFASVSNW